MTPAQRVELARLALAVPRPTGRFCKSDPQGLEKLEAYVDSYAERARDPEPALMITPVIDACNWYKGKLTLRGRVKRWLGLAV